MVNPPPSALDRERVSRPQTLTDSAAKNRDLPALLSGAGLRTDLLTHAVDSPRPAPT